MECKFMTGLNFRSHIVLDSWCIGIISNIHFRRISAVDKIGLIKNGTEYCHFDNFQLIHAVYMTVMYIVLV